MIEDINVTKTIEQTREMLDKNRDVPKKFSILILDLLTILEIFLTRLNKNSKSSSILPFQDTNRKKPLRPERKVNNLDARQLGLKEKNLTPVEIIEIHMDKKTLPKEHIYEKVGIAKRQVVEFILSRHVIEYHLDILADEKGNRFIAKPKGASRSIQYGISTNNKDRDLYKDMALYMSM